ncbi:hypothetical protein V9T40_007580 [Parthenolecanium corni]|uniref:Uncharacterized protein n=1 Tax=Parthenolecanium corni TaxID=536013 RepID=A0AAN9THW7_9HEMI
MTRKRKTTTDSTDPTRRSITIHRTQESGDYSCAAAPLSYVETMLEPVHVTKTVDVFFTLKIIRLAATVTRGHDTIVDNKASTSISRMEANDVSFFYQRTTNQSPYNMPKVG